MYYWKYGQRSLITRPVGISSTTSLHDTWSSGSREIGQEAIHLEIVWSNLGVMCSWVMHSEVVSKVS